MALLLFALGLAGCEGCNGCGNKEAAVQDAGVEPPVAAPEGVLAEAVLATPDATWTRFQRGVGGLLAIMAPTIGGLVASVAGADPALGPEIDGGAPAYGIISGSPPSLVLCLRARNAGRAKEILAGDGGRFRAAGETGSLALFEPTGNGYAIGVASSGWVLVGKTKDDVGKLGPYAYRTLPTRPLPKANVHVDFTHDAFAKWLGAFAGAKWSDAKTFLLAKDADMRAAHGGREPDFGDARAIVDLLDGWVKSRSDALADVDTGMLDVDIADDAIHGSLGLAPGGGPSKTLSEAMRPGRITIGPLPSDTLLAVAMHDDLASRKDTAKDLGDGVGRVLGKRLGETDVKQVGAALDAFASAHGDWLGLGIGRTGTLVRTPAGDKADEATKNLVAVLEKPALKAPLGPVAGKVKDGVIQIAIADKPEQVFGIATDGRFDAALSKSEASFVIAGHLLDEDPITTVAATRKDGKIAVVIDAAPVAIREIIKSLTSM
jgi:hypothetical protein